MPKLLYKRYDKGSPAYPHFHKIKLYTWLVESIAVEPVNIEGWLYKCYIFTLESKSIVLCYPYSESWDCPKLETFLPYCLCCHCYLILKFLKKKKQKTYRQILGSNTISHLWKFIHSCLKSLRFRTKISCTDYCRVVLPLGSQHVHAPIPVIHIS